MGLVDSTGRPLAGELTDEQLIALSVEELRALPAPAILAFAPSDFFVLVSILQLAQRHPNLPALNRAFAVHVVEIAREYFRTCPTVLELIARGDDVEQDVEITTGMRVTP